MFIERILKIANESAMSRNGKMITLNIDRLHYLLKNEKMFSDKAVNKALEKFFEDEEAAALAMQQEKERQAKIAADERVQKAAAKEAAAKAQAERAAEAAERAKEATEDAAREVADHLEAKKK